MVWRWETGSWIPAIALLRFGSRDLGLREETNICSSKHEGFGARDVTEKRAVEGQPYSVKQAR